jgi:hypothetical protein
MDSIAGATDDHHRHSAARTIELLREVERVLLEMNADLSVAENKLARATELMAEREQVACGH